MANITTTTAANFIPEIWSDGVKNYLERKLVFEQLVDSSYFKAPKMTGANSWKATTGNTKEGVKILAHSNKIKMPKGLPVRPIIGNQPKDDVVHPKLKKEFLRVYSERLFRTISKIPKKEFL